MLTKTQSRQIERLQAQALRTIWGWEKSYRECLSLSGMERLEERRRIALTNFAKRTSQNPRYADWFPENDNNSYNLRNSEQYQIHFAKHERLKRAPIYAMRRILNDDWSGDDNNDLDDFD